MVNYGYGPETKRWDESKKHILARSLLEMVDQMKKDGTVKSVDACIFDENGMAIDGTAPYIEVDQLYRGVRIRKITHLNKEQTDKLIKTADKIYLDIMSGTSEKEEVKGTQL